MSFDVLRPPPAVGHVSVSFKNFVLVWGGYTMEVKSFVDSFICLVMGCCQFITIFISSICSLMKQAIIKIMYLESFYSHSIQNLTYGL
jgi:hypothetical protein